MQHAYTSFNKALEAILLSIAPDVPIFFEQPEPSETLPSEYFQIYWLNTGSQKGRASEQRALVQIDIFVPRSNPVLAFEWAAKLNEALGFTVQPGFGTLLRSDWTSDPETYLSDMRVEPWEDGWVRVPDPPPLQVHYARTVALTYET